MSASNPILRQQINFNSSNNEREAIEEIKNEVKSPKDDKKMENTKSNENLKARY